MRKALCICLAVLLCTVLAAGCTQSTDTEESTAAQQSLAASASASDSAKTDLGLAEFFQQWPTRLEALAGIEEVEKPEVSESISTMVSAARDWRSHLEGDTATIELPSANVVLRAQGSDTKLENVSIACIMPDQAASESSAVIVFTIGAGALVEVLSYEADDGMQTVTEAVAALLSGSSEDGVLRSKPVTVGGASYEVTIVSATRVLKLSGTPT